MPAKDTVLDLIKNKRYPYNYIVGEKSTGKPLPFDVKLSVDKDFKDAITKWVTIGSISIGMGICVGIVISKYKR